MDSMIRLLYERNNVLELSLEYLDTLKGQTLFSWHSEYEAIEQTITMNQDK